MRVIAKLTLFALLALGSMVGCATLPTQTDIILKNPGVVPSQAWVDHVPFISQDKNQCGPASLAMILNWNGDPATQEELTSQMYTPGKQGTLQGDILGAARRHGFLAIPITGMGELLAEISNHHPVLIFENLGFSWYPQWHYAVATAYDLKEKFLRLHSGRDADKEVDLQKFEKSWKLADYWGVVVLKPDELSATADSLAHLTAASALEQNGHQTEAALAYRSMLKKWPDDAGALIGLANIAYNAKDFSGAVRYLNQASKAHPKNAIVWHNLAHAYLAHGNTRAAKTAARTAMKYADSGQADSFRESLGKPTLGSAAGVSQPPK